MHSIAKSNVASGSTPSGTTVAFEMVKVLVSFSTPTSLSPLMMVSESPGTYVVAKRPSAVSATVHSAPSGRPSISIGAPSETESGPDEYVPPGKMPVHSTEMVNTSPSRAGVAATPRTSFVIVRVSVSSVFSNPTSSVRGVVNSIPSVPTKVGATRRLIVQPDGTVSVTVQVDPGGTSGRPAASAIAMPPTVVSDVVVLATSTPSKVHVIAKSKVPSMVPTMSLDAVRF